MKLPEPDMWAIEITEEWVDITDLSNWIFSSVMGKEDALHPNPNWANLSAVGYGYPYKELIASIKQHGFDPAFPDVTYHSEAFADFSQSFILIARPDGGYVLPCGGHRLTAAKFAGLDKIKAFVHRKRTITDEQLSEFKEILAYLNRYEREGAIYYQIWKFPDGLHYEGRDDCHQTFLGFPISRHAWPGRTVLDLACNTGFFAIYPGLKGAAKIKGIDNNPYAIEVANRIAKASRLKCEYKFEVANFWEYPFEEQFDYVFANQCLHHFLGPGYTDRTIEEVFERISRVTKRALFMYYRFIDVEPGGDPPCGYCPPIPKLKSDLIAQGFEKVMLIPGQRGKNHIVAIKPYDNVVAPAGVIDG